MTDAGSAAPTGSPDFSRFGRAPLVNAKTGRPYELVRADRVPPTPDSIGRIAAICNEPRIYEFLFRGRLAGAPYPPEKAREFLAWAARGWRDGTHFVFLALDGQGLVAAAADLKSPALDRAEIGYWASAAHAGVATPAVARVCEAARDAGYRGLFAAVRKDNARSAAVLERNGFRREERDDLRDPAQPRFAYFRRLD